MYELNRSKVSKISFNLQENTVILVTNFILIKLH
jgi:hypothetical protein